MGNLILLGDLPPLEPFLELDCRQCGRHGRLSLPRLLAKHGEAYPVAHIIAEATADCRARNAQSIYDGCKACCPQLPGWMVKPHAP